ncbi:hypothetical protein JXC34_03515 [Candidatus Woesearchaeota archaeon]|nr:hypothetical protein [Candidatus Woesearchaeota archaeon]
MESKNKYIELRDPLDSVPAIKKDHGFGDYVIHETQVSEDFHEPWMNSTEKGEKKYYTVYKKDEPVLQFYTIFYPDESIIEYQAADLIERMTTKLNSMTVKDLKAAKDLEDRVA